VKKILLLCLCFALWLFPYAEAASKTVAVFPFTVNAAKDYSFLQNGIMDMLCSRLASENELQPIEKGRILEAVKSYKGALDQQAAQTVGKSLPSDYVVFGSLTVLGESVSIDARILDVNQQHVLESVFAQAKTMDDVVPQVNEFAISISARILGKKPAAAQGAREEKATSTEKAAEAAPHLPLLAPSYLLSPTEKIKTQSSPLNPAFISEETPGSEEMIWQSGSLPFYVKGMDIGDIDGDGKNELVLVSPKNLYVYRKGQTGLAQIQKIGTKRFEEFISVDVADIDGNGRAEVYAVKELGVSGLTTSSVLEWKETALQPTIAETDWYFRVLESPGESPQLIGQKKRSENTFEDTSVFHLEKKGNEIIEGSAIALPQYTNVYNFAFASFEGGARRLVRINSSEYLEVLDTAGEILWESDTYFGGTINYLIKKVSNQGTDEGPERFYVPARIIVADLHGDGSSDIIVNKNASSTFRLTERYKYFSRGQMVSLSWKSLGLAENWTTRSIPGYVSDYTYKDLDNDGHRDLVVATVRLDPAGFKEGHSTIISFALKSGVK
jgi:TolB-like protein